MERNEILLWLKEADPDRLRDLWHYADQARAGHVGPEVHLRGLVEFSNCCRRNCLYCGIRRDNTRVQRYRMSIDEILQAAHLAVEFGYGTLVLQSGEDHQTRGEYITQAIERVKSETDLAVTLSLGEATDTDLRRWRQAGADRYLLRFETSNRHIYERIHPPGNGTSGNRLAQLLTLRELGYEVGSGIMVGIPGTSHEDLVSDLLLMRELDLDMIGIGPFIAHPATPLGQSAGSAGDQQSAGDAEMIYKVLALTRLLCPETNIPATSAVATLDPAQGRQLALERGANVVMPNLTPEVYRQCYEIYPDKAGHDQTPEQTHRAVISQLADLGRQPGQGPGASPRYRARQRDGLCA